MQHWADPSAPDEVPRSWLRLVLNGRPAQDARFTGKAAHRELADYWSGRVAAFAASALTEAQAWAKLLELAGVVQSRCGLNGCPGVLPVAWWFCPVCGRDVRRSGFGGAVASASKPVILLDRRGISRNPR